MWPNETSEKNNEKKKLVFTEYLHACLIFLLAKLNQFAFHSYHF